MLQCYAFQGHMPFSMLHLRSTLAPPPPTGQWSLVRDARPARHRHSASDDHPHRVIRAGSFCSFSSSSSSSSSFYSSSSSSLFYSPSFFSSSFSSSPSSFHLLLHLFPSPSYDRLNFTQYYNTIQYNTIQYNTNTKTNIIIVVLTP